MTARHGRAFLPLIACVVVCETACALAVFAGEKIIPVHVPEGHLENPSFEESKAVGSLVDRGDTALRAGKLFDAYSLYRHAIKVNEGAARAYEGLALVSEARGDHSEFLMWMHEAITHAPAEKLGALNLHLGDHLAALARWSDAEVAYRAAVPHARGGDQEFLARYGLGLSLYKQRRFREAEVWLREAEQKLAGVSAGVRRDKAALTHLLLAESYAALKFPRYSIAEAQDALSAGGNDEVVHTARKVEDALDQPLHRLSFALSHEYDTNVLAPTNTVVELNGRKALGGGSILSKLDLELASTPARRWSFGVDLPVSLDTHTSSTLAALDTWITAPTAWVAWWNLRNMEFKLFYDYTAAALDRDNYKLFMQTHGPELTWRYFWDKRHEVDAGYFFHTVFYPGDAPEAPVNTNNQQSGQEQRAFVRLAFAGPSPRVQPFVKYTFDDNLARGKNLYALINTFEAGFAAWLGEGRARLLVSGAYSKVDFSETVGRGDRVGRARAAFELPLGSRITARVEADYTSSHSELQTLFSFDRLVITSGLTCALPF